jgi:hypothetical protein
MTRTVAFLVAIAAVVVVTGVAVLVAVPVLALGTGDGARATAATAAVAVAVLVFVALLRAGGPATLVVMTEAAPGTVRSRSPRAAELVLGWGSVRRRGL